MMRLSELAVYAGTDLAEVVRDCEVESAELCADIRGTAVLTFLEKEKFLPCLDHPGISAVICTKELADKNLGAYTRITLIRCTEVCLLQFIQFSGKKYRAPANSHENWRKCADFPHCIHCAL